MPPVRSTDPAAVPVLLAPWSLISISLLVLVVLARSKIGEVEVSPKSSPVPVAVINAPPEVLPAVA